MEGSHSTCCNRVKSDACLSSGLCLNTEAVVAGHILWATGCTDKTMKDKACPKVCHGHNSELNPLQERREDQRQTADGRELTRRTWAVR